MLCNMQIINGKSTSKWHHHKTANGHQCSSSKTNPVIFFGNGMS